MKLRQFSLLVIVGLSCVALQAAEQKYKSVSVINSTDVDASFDLLARIQKELLTPEEIVFQNNLLSKELIQQDLQTKALREQRKQRYFLNQENRKIRKNIFTVYAQKLSTPSENKDENIAILESQVNGTVGYSYAPWLDSRKIRRDIDPRAADICHFICCPCALFCCLNQFDYWCCKPGVPSNETVKEHMATVLKGVETRMQDLDKEEQQEIQALRNWKIVICSEEASTPALQPQNSEQISVPGLQSQTIEQENISTVIDDSQK